LHRCYVPRGPPSCRKFRYEIAWQLKPGFHEMVTDSWNTNLHNPFMAKLAACAYDMPRGVEIIVKN